MYLTCWKGENERGVVVIKLGGVEVSDKEKRKGRGELETKRLNFPEITLYLRKRRLSVNY